MNFLRALCIGVVLLLNTEIGMPSAQAKLLQARQGVIDFEGRLQVENGPIRLNGEWEFYWRQLLTPEDFKNGPKPTLTGYLTLPGYWNDYKLGDSKLGGKGYATFRLVIDNVIPYRIISLIIPRLNSSYRLYVNGVLTMQCGAVGTTEERSQPRYCTRVPQFYLDQERIELILQIANFHHGVGGVWQGISLADYYIADLKIERQLAWDLFLIGALLIMGLYYLGVFSLRKTEGSTLFFGLFCLTLALRTSFHNSSFFLEIFPELAWQIYARLDYLTLTVPVILFATFLYLLFPNEFAKGAYRTIVTVALLFSVLTLVLHPSVFTGLLLYYQIQILAACSYFLYLMTRAILHKRNGASEMTVGFVILFAAIFNDILHAQSVINTTFLTSFGLFLFFFSQSYVITKRFTNALNTAEELTVNLGSIVKDQTSEIRDLLDNTGQGILCFDQNMIIQDHASRATQVIFEQPIHELNILELMFPENKEEIKGFLDILFKSGGKLNLVKNLLPTQFIRNDKHYDLAFRWIPAGKNKPARIMMILTDVTIKRKLEMMLAKDERQNQKIIRIAVDRHGFLRFYNGIQNSLLTIENELKSPVASINASDLARNFHTIKGGLASYSFFEVAEIAHKAESLLEAFIFKDEPLSLPQVEALLATCNELKTVFKEKIFELGDLIPKQLLNVSKTDFYRISEEKISRLEEFLQVQQVKQPELSQLINDLRKQPLRNTLKKIASDAKYIAFQEGKQVAVEYSGEDTQVIHAELDLFLASLVHLVRNAIDHGIEPPNERRNLGKSETGRIMVAVTLHDRIFTLVFADDGRGIDVTTLKERAVAMGIRTRAQVDLLSESAGWQLIFEPGLSVKKTPNSLSGRGIGMDAVVWSINQLKGTIAVRSGIGTGTTFTFQIPVTF